MILTATSAGTSVDTLYYLLAKQKVGAVKCESMETSYIQQKVEGFLSWHELLFHEP